MVTVKFCCQVKSSQWWSLICLLNSTLYHPPEIFEFLICSVLFPCFIIYSLWFMFYSLRLWGRSVGSLQAIRSLTAFIRDGHMGWAAPVRPWTYFTSSWHNPYDWALCFLVLRKVSVWCICSLLSSRLLFNILCRDSLRVKLYKQTLKQEKWAAFLIFSHTQGHRSSFMSLFVALSPQVSLWAINVWADF